VPDRIDPTERAHLRDESGYSPPIFRYTASPDLAELVRRHWVPVWVLPEGRVSEQRVLQYPTCQVVITPAYAALVGPHPGLGTERLEGSGWAVGAALQPAAGRPLAGRAVHEIAGERVPLAELDTLDGAALTVAVRDVMAPDPLAPERQQRAIALVEAALRTLLPVDEDGLLVNAVVEHVEGDPRVQRVGQVCEKFAISERTLQRLTRSRIGLSPKWLVQRRRLHEAAELLRAGEAPDLARIAADLGYSDQAHFSRDFRTATGLTPGRFAGEPS
jgi:AraC-like DNA-binding protein